MSEPIVIKKLGMDFQRPFKNNVYIFVIEYLSRYYENLFMTNITTEKSSPELEDIFCRFGLVEVNDSFIQWTRIY